MSNCFFKQCFFLHSLGLNNLTSCPTFNPRCQPETNDEHNQSNQQEYQTRKQVANQVSQGVCQPKAHYPARAVAGVYLINRVS